MIYIHTAARQGRLKLLARKISEGLKDQHHPTSRYYETPLHAAIVGSSIEVVKMLIDSKVKLEAMCSSGETALHWAAIGGKNDFIKLLLEAGSDIESVCRNTGATPLIYAIEYGRVEVVRTLIASGAQINFLFQFKSYTPPVSPLYHAIYYRRKDCLEVLMECERTDYEIRDSKGLTVADCFNEKYSEEMEIYKVWVERRSLKKLTERIQRGRLNPFPSGVQGVFGLMLDERWLDYHKLDRDKASRNSLGQTTLHLAASLGRADIVECLLKMDSDPWAYDCEGRTALDMALDAESAELISARMCAVGKPPPLPTQTVSSRKRM